MATATMEHLRDQVRGEILTPEDAAYDEARRVYNAMIDRRPRVVVRCAGVDDVVAAVNFAREAGLSIAVRGGSHSVPGFGTADDAVVIDLVRMQEVEVDPTRKTARAQGGATWGAFNDATHEHGLATTGGIISTTGVGGLTLGGGIGYLSRGCGLSCDNLRAAEVVTADGRIVTASAHENEDLFWALRGGGGNFGVVTAFEYDLHPVREVYGGPILFELSDAADVLRFYREFIRDAPEEFGGFPAWQIAPPLPFIPEDRQGEPFLIFVTCWAGPIEQGEAALKPLREVAPVVAEHVGPMPYPAINSAFDALVPAGPPALLEGELRQGAHRRRDRRAPRARAEGADGQLDRAHLPDQRRLPPGGARRDGVRLPRRDVRDGDRRHVAGPRRERREHGMGARLLRRDRAPLGGGRLRQLHGRRRPGADQGQLQGQLRPPGRRQAQVRPRQPLPPQPEHQALTACPA